MKIHELFVVKSGNYIDLGEFNDNNEEQILYLRPSKNILNTISSYVAISRVKKSKIFPANSIVVGTNGEGSHTYSYVIPYRFTANSDVAVLIPKQEMSITEKLFFSRAITANRPLFSYGRKPKGKKLLNIDLPTIPEYVNKTKIDYHIISTKNSPKNMSLNIENWKEFPLNKFFDFKRGRVQNTSELRGGKIPLVTALTENNGIAGYVDTDDKNIFDGNCLTVANTGQGSVFRTFYQDKPFAPSNNVTVLVPKQNFSKYIGLFICCLCWLEIPKYSYGRIVNNTALNNTIVKLPAGMDGNPDWDYMEDYIKGLPYSDRI